MENIIHTSLRHIFLTGFFYQVIHKSFIKPEEIARGFMFHKERFFYLHIA